ncbi:MAG: helix-turn-helix domain-containing protein [Bacilli bacterium]
MLANKEVNKIRTMYYEQNYTATEIARIMKISRQTVYKYLKFVDFSDDITQKKTKSPVEQYKEDILKFLNYDRLHHHKQRHTGTKVYQRLKELYPDYNISKYATIRYFSRVKKEFYYKHNGYLPLIIYKFCYIFKWIWNYSILTISYIINIQ